MPRRQTDQGHQLPREGGPRYQAVGQMLPSIATCRSQSLQCQEEDLFMTLQGDTAPSDLHPTGREMETGHREGDPLCRPREGEDLDQEEEDGQAGVPAGPQGLPLPPGEDAATWEGREATLQSQESPRKAQEEGPIGDRRPDQDPEERF